jgi:methionyl-tRNA formyltransferase
LTVRVFLAGAPGAPLTDAARTILLSSKAVSLVGESARRLTAAELRPLAPDLLVSAAHGHFIAREVRDVPRVGCVGLHPSLLPKYRGSYPLWWALRAGENEVGLTLFQLGSGIDDGPILDQRVVRVLPDDTFKTLYERVAPLASPMLADLLAVVDATRRLPLGTAQDDDAATVFRTPSVPLRAFMKATWRLRALTRQSRRRG